MKLRTRTLTVLGLLLFGFTEPVIAQSLAVRMTEISGKTGCVKLELENLSNTSPVTVTSVLLRVFDAKACKLLCTFEGPIDKASKSITIKQCQRYSSPVPVCCQKEFLAPSEYIYFIRVLGSSGALTEGWLFTP
jgi:hypothetical protein